MACATGELARDCAILHWCPALNARAEANVWRADCPMCGAVRAIEFDVRGRGIRWNSFCSRHPKEALRPTMRDLLGGCLPGSGKTPISHDELAALALAEISPAAMRLAMLELAGFSTADALAKLGIRRENRARVIKDRASVSMQKRRSLQPAIPMRPARPFGCKTAGRSGVSKACFRLVTSSAPGAARGSGAVTAHRRTDAGQGERTPAGPLR